MKAYKVTVRHGEMGSINDPMNSSFTYYYHDYTQAVCERVPNGAIRYSPSDSIEMWVLNERPDEFLSFFGHTITLQTEVTIETIEIQ